MKLYGLKAVRIIYGFTMRDLAERINVSANLINLWERGDVDVPDSRIDNLVEYLGIEKELLFKSEHNSRELMKIEIGRSNFKIKEHLADVEEMEKAEILKDLFNIEFNPLKEEEKAYKDYYKYVFVFNNLVVTVAAKSKLEAINKLQKEYSDKFEENFQVYQIDFNINNEDIEEKYL